MTTKRSDKDANKALWGALGLLGLVVLALLAGASPSPASEADMYYQCSSTSASGVTTYGWCPVGTQYPLPTTAVPSGGAGVATYSPLTLGTSDAVVVSSATGYVDIFNVSNSATVCLAFAGVTATISGTQCSAGEYSLPPLWRHSWPEGGSGVLPGFPIHGIASAAGTQVSVGVK